jgi:PAS domain S-box-containing protein
MRSKRNLPPLQSASKNLRGHIAITSRVVNQEEKEFLHYCLGITSKNLGTKTLLDELVIAIKLYTGFDAVGIRLLGKQGGIPYTAYKGFSRAFLKKESPLSIKTDACMCINVIMGKLFFKSVVLTSGGSFFTNSTSESSSNMLKTEKTKIRNVCHDFGYESVALVPIRLGNRILGLIHLADHRVDMVPATLVELLELVAIELGTAIRRLRAEERLAEAEDRYHALLHLGAEVGEAIVILQDVNGIEGMQVLFNDEWPRLTGYNDKELHNMSFFDLLLPQDKTSSLARHRQKMAGKAIPGLYELSIIRKNREILPVEITSAFTTIKKGRANVAYIRDISQRREAELMLKQSESLYRVLFETTGTATCIIESNGIISLVNQELCKMTGYDKERIENKIHALSLIETPDVEKAAYYYRMRSIEPNSVPNTYSCKLVCNNDRRVEALATVNMIPGTKNRIASFLDITILKKTEKELSSSENRLRMLSHRLLSVQEEERARIARDLHDLLAQELAAIKLAANSLSSKLTNSILKDKANELVSLSDSLIITTRKLSTALRPEMLDKLGLVKAIQWYAEAFERQTGISCPVDDKTQGIDLTEIDKDKTIAVYRIFQEAMTNVLRHAKATQVLVNVAIKPTKGLILSVIDDGVGMSLSKVSDESGIGLLGMRERALAVGGNLRISSQSNRGTRLVASIPLNTNRGVSTND